MKDIVKNAEKATDAAEERWSVILKAVQAPRWTNGAGVYADRQTIAQRLLQIEAAARAAHNALGAVPWPSDEDYDS